MVQEVTWVVLTVVARDDRFERDLGLARTDAPNPPERWLTVARGEYPGKWPPAPGDRVTIQPARLVKVVRGKANAGDNRVSVSDSPVSLVSENPT